MQIASGYVISIGMTKSTEGAIMRKRGLVLGVGIIMLLATAVCPQQTKSEFVRGEAPKQQATIKISITAGGPFGPPRDQFRAGEQVPVAITMTNTSSEPVYVCISSPLYQDLPTLTKDGRSLPYMSWQASELQYSKRTGMCADVSLPEPALLPPNKPTLVDWFVLSDNSSLVTDPWYDPLPPGHYELSLRRRIDCCDGPMVESDKTDFEVTP